jgi:hypothetical protein
LLAASGDALTVATPEAISSSVQDTAPSQRDAAPDACPPLVHVEPPDLRHSREGDSGETGALAGFEDRRIRVRPSRGLSREGLPCFPLVIGQGPDPRCERCCAEQHQGDSITLATLLSGRKPTTTASTRAIGLQIGTARRRASATATSRTPRTGSGAEDDKQNRGCRALLDPLDEGRHLLGLGGRVGHLERHHVDDVERSRRHHPDDDERAPE